MLQCFNETEKGRDFIGARRIKNQERQLMAVWSFSCDVSLSRWVFPKILENPPNHQF